MKGSRKVTLVDVAAHAGVSSTTASYILNGRSAQMRIAPETEQRVREVAASLGYRPNRSARSLRTSSTKTIGLISDFVASGQFSSQMLAGASAAARLHDHLLVIGETEGDPELEARLIDEMVERSVDGVVYATIATSEITLPRALSGVRAVLLNCVDHSSAAPAVLPDERQGGRVAARMLVDAVGSEGIWVVGEDPTPEALAGPLRVAGLKDGLTARGAAIAGTVPCLWAPEAAFEAVNGWLSSGVRPRALVCLNDRIAMGCYQALAAHGLTVPDDVQVVSFDGSDLARWLRPALTSVGLPFTELGELAVRALMEPDSVTRQVLRVPMPVHPGDSLRVSPRPRAGGGDPTYGARI